MYPCTVIALDIGGTKIAGALLHYEQEGVAPRVGERCNQSTDARRGGAAVLRTVIDVALELKSRASEEPVGIGIAAAGCISPDDGSVLYANDIMPGWTGQPLAMGVGDTCGLPCAAFGDVQGHALGEARWGAAKGLSSCLLVAAGTGLGGALVLDGKVVRGAHGASGHIGHTLHSAAAGIACTCGAQAHVENVTSGRGIGSLYQGVPESDPGYDFAVDGAEVSRRAAEGDEKAREAIERAGFALGQAMGSWANMLDPEAFILTGTVTKAGELWRAAVERGFAEQALPPMGAPRILSAQLGGDAPLVGAAENLLDSLKK